MIGRNLATVRPRLEHYNMQPIVRHSAPLRTTVHICLKPLSAVYSSRVQISSTLSMCCASHGQVFRWRRRPPLLLNSGPCHDPNLALIAEPRVQLIVYIVWIVQYCPHKFIYRYLEYNFLLPVQSPQQPVTTYSVHSDTSV